jgi:hypothetical protein
MKFQESYLVLIYSLAVKEIVWVYDSEQLLLQFLFSIKFWGNLSN